jgi:hypothetical protein
MTTATLPGSASRITASSARVRATAVMAAPG